MGFDSEDGVLNKLVFPVYRPDLHSQYRVVVLARPLVFYMALFLTFNIQVYEPKCMDTAISLQSCRVIEQ